MKARKVKNLDPARPLAENAARIVAVRLDELRSFAPEALEPDSATAQHDMRIAAKRLRYVLELTEICFGDAGPAGRRAARDLQGILGDIHDCDVMQPMATEHLDRLRGLETLAVQLGARRRLLFDEFARIWEEQGRSGVWDALAAAASGPPGGGATLDSEGLRE